MYSQIYDVILQHFPTTNNDLTPAGNRTNKGNYQVHVQVQLALQLLASYAGVTSPLP